MIHSLKNSSYLIKISCTQEAFNVHFNKNRAHLWRTTAVVHLLRWHSGMNLPAMQEMQKTQVRSLGQEDPLEEEMATHSSILSWRIPWTEESGRLQSMGLQRVGHNWATEHTHSSSNWSSLYSIPHVKVSISHYYQFYYIPAFCSLFLWSNYFHPLFHPFPQRDKNGWKITEDR